MIIEKLKNTIICGDTLRTLRRFPDNSVDCVITSPPYWGLRDYGTAKWQGGDLKCEHRKNPAPFSKKALVKSTIGAACSTGYAQEGYKDICGKCGAKRIDAQLGLEKTPEKYVVKMVKIFREVKRVLKKEGTCWLNLGDTYSAARWSSGKGQPMNKGRDIHRSGKETSTRKSNLPDKNLVGIPWRVAFALQADGWYLRQDIIWHKPNPMPESVKDRCTKAHEYIFLLTKSPKYFFDSEAIKEPVKEMSLRRAEYGWDCDCPSTKNASMGGEGIHTEKMGTRFVDPTGRNKRSVWTITVKANPIRGVHFATFPEDLIIPMIKAGTSEKGIVLDPFAGSGTVGVVALKLKRDYLLIDLNPKYCEMAAQRIRDIPPILI